ncbi:ArsR/SmtB family transcription factor [Cohaesibacter marisflavi]|uniref:ArsR/SmtB family transcription factor n=1 Tax=Cohaesibacter marisflavi TaxID=655353 RepID=UPI000B7DF76D|nr:metalloregulator ArsR/SmtB family transcription factor [Cohaesibacter marisflavi]
MNDESSAKMFAALSSPVRLRILLWLLEPRAHFPEQQDGDLVDDGVCVGFITEKIGLTQPTVSAHMKKLAEAELVTSKRIGNWIFYRPQRKKLKILGNWLLCAADNSSVENSTK